MKVALVPLTLALLVGCSGAPTQRASDVEPLKMDNVGVFLEYQESLRDGYQDGSLGSLNEREQRLFEDSQRTIERLLGDVDSVDELSANQKVELYNAQEAINGIIRGNAANRQICRRQVARLHTRPNATPHASAMRCCGRRSVASTGCGAIPGSAPTAAAESPTTWVAVEPAAGPSVRRHACKPCRPSSRSPPAASGRCGAGRPP